MRISTTLKSISAAVLITSPLAYASARSLSPEEALQRVKANTHGMRIPGNHQMQLSYTESLEGNDLVYVFNNSADGFIVVGGDDRMEALLGYSDSGTFDYESAPPALKWWLSQYAEEASQTVETLIPSNMNQRASKAPETEDRAPIPTLIKTKWGQTAPYNLYCPELFGNKCVTGCVATALAQVINYFGYPSTGKGSHNYGWNGQILEYDFSTATFDYANMLDLYNDIFVPNGKIDATETQEKAVANLMYACGIAVNMNYNLQASSASDVYIPFALREFFNYDGNAKYFKRTLFLNSDWENLIYSELKEGRPVIYGGQTISGGGHQFICDGYGEYGTFHINWGWEGLADGYYRLSSLLPDQQGTGGFEGGYNSNQSIVCGIQPYGEQISEWYPLYAGGSLRARPATYTTGEQFNGAVEISINNGLANNSPEPLSVDLVIKAVSESGTEYISDTSYHYNFSGIGTYGSSLWNFTPVYLPSDLPAGKYQVYLMIKKSDGSYQEILYPVIDSNHFILDVASDGFITCSEGQPTVKAEIRVTEIRILNDLVSGEQGRFQINIQNEGEYEYAGSFTLKFFNTNGDGESDDFTYNLPSIPAGNMAIVGPYFTIPMKPGTYELICFDKYGEPISDAIQIVIGDAGVEAILPANASADIYTSGGVLVKKNASIEAISSLPKGIYILNVGGKAYKIAK